jgi:tetratricopeptide (TPR) repeat protein
VSSNAVQTLQVLTEFESQLRANQTAIEESREEARLAAAQSAEMFAKGLQTVQETFSSQQHELSERYERELLALQSSNRVVLILGGIFAGVASLALLMVAYFQWRMSKLWSDLAVAGSATPRLGLGWEPRGLSAGEASVAAGQAGEASARLLQALARLETRVQDLERGSTTSRQSTSEAFAEGGTREGYRPSGPLTEMPAGTSLRDQSPFAGWLEQAQSMVRQNDWEGAVSCLNEVLNLEPNHGEALVKKGAALEHLKRLNEAFECYDRAIAADDSMTIAYLHKGGLCSRLERFKEALECYEKALKTHDGW